MSPASLYHYYFSLILYCNSLLNHLAFSAEGMTRYWVKNCFWRDLIDFLILVIPSSLDLWLRSSKSFLVIAKNYFYSQLRYEHKVLEYSYCFGCDLKIPLPNCCSLCETKIFLGDDFWSHRKLLGAQVLPVAFWHWRAGSESTWVQSLTQTFWLYRQSMFHRSLLRKTNQKSHYPRHALSMLCQMLHSIWEVWEEFIFKETWLLLHMPWRLPASAHMW